MPLRIEPTTPAGQDVLIQFLVSVFRSSPTAPFVDPRLIDWKYFQPYEGRSGPRSFILKQGNEIAAHTGIVPITLLAPNREVTCIHLIDWAASPNVPGAGVLLLREAASLADTILAVGGSSDTRLIMPKLGFKQVGTLKVFARVTRPLGQLKARTFKGWKAPFRLLRNSVWSLSSVPDVPADWSAVPVPRFDSSVLSTVWREPAEFTVCGRTLGLLNYMLGCPGALFSAFLIAKNAQVLGYFMLSRIGGQCRIADLVLDSSMSEAWRSAYALATRTAAADPGTCEVVAASSIPLVTNAIIRNGFHVRDDQPIFLNDPKHLLSGAPPLNISLLDGEGSYLNDPAHPFLT